MTKKELRDKIVKTFDDLLIRESDVKAKEEKKAKKCKKK